jgi:hypothetical protein
MPVSKHDKRIYFWGVCSRNFWFVFWEGVVAHGIGDSNHSVELFTPISEQTARKTKFWQSSFFVGRHTHTPPPPKKHLCHLNNHHRKIIYWKIDKILHPVKREVHTYVALQFPSPPWFSNFNQYQSEGVYLKRRGGEHCGNRSSHLQKSLIFRTFLAWTQRETEVAIGNPPLENWFQPTLEGVGGLHWKTV